MLNAQYRSSNDIKSTWVDIGTGIFTHTNTVDRGGTVLNFAVNNSTNNKMYRVRFNFAKELDWFVDRPEYNISNGILFGKEFNINRFDFYLLGGVGFMSGAQRKSATSYIYYSTPSIPIELDIRYAAFKKLGFSLSVFGEVNGVNPMRGIIIKSNFGEFR